MASNGIQNQEGVPENLRKLLAVAVRSVQWSYAIFWSLSSEQEGVLEWGDGYYNGDIKTRKTVEAMELKADKMGLQRSEQLRELYGSLLEGETTEQQAKRPCASLSPEDLTDAEWYYLVCMSFVFNPGQGLPGRALANGQSIWLCNAHSADSKVFSRSLLAKSASIQTVLCFPHLGGVVELGVTELVLEDPTLIQHIKTSILEFSKPKCSEKSTAANEADDDTDHMCIKVDNDIPDVVDTMALENICIPIEDIGFDQEGLNELHGKIHENSTMGSPEDCSNGGEHNHQTEDSQVQSWHYTDDDYSNCFPASMNSSDCVSQVFVNQEKTNFHPKGGNGNTRLHLNELQDCNQVKLSSLDLGNNEDSHYTRTVSTILRNSQGSIENLWFQSCNHKSVFVSWKKEGIVGVHRPKEQQRMLKMVLLNVPLMHSGFSLMSQKENSGEDRLWKPEMDEVCVKYVLPEKRTENGKFMVLRSMVPSISKIDKASILGDTIEYLKELEARVEELESCIYLAEHESRARAKYPDMIEQTSDRYDIRRIVYGKMPWINKRKAHEIDENDLEQKSVVVKEVPLLDVKVSIEKEEVLIEMRCPWREYLLLDIMDVVNNLNLDAHSVQSSTIDGVLTLTLQSKFRGAEVASTKMAEVASTMMIKQALSRIAGKC